MAAMMLGLVLELQRMGPTSLTDCVDGNDWQHVARFTRSTGQARSHLRRERASCAAEAQTVLLGDTQ